MTAIGDDLRQQLAAGRETVRQQVISLRTEPAVAELRSRILADAAQRREPDELLAATLRRCLQMVPYYRRQTDLHTDPVRLDRFPILTKQTLVEAFVDLIAADPDTGLVGHTGRILLARTSGSTGQPAAALKDEDDGYWDDVFFHRMTAHFGVPDDGELWDLGPRYATEPLVRAKPLQQAGIAWKVPGLNQDLPWLTDLYEALMTVSRPALIFGSPYKLVRLAEFCEARGIDFIRPRAVITSYDQLNDNERAYMAEVFAAPVRAQYGTAETGLVAWECSRSRLHYESDKVLIELLKTDGSAAAPGESGRLIITSLVSRAMPVVRYETGDVAIAAPDTCECDLAALPCVQRLEGRTAARLISANGTAQSAMYVTEQLVQLGLRTFQLVQDRPGVVRVVTRGVTDGEKLVAQLRMLLGDTLQNLLTFEVDEGGDFILTASGKRNPVIQLLDRPVSAASDPLQLLPDRD